MTFSTVIDTRSGTLVGLLIEQDRGGLVAIALAGDDDSPDGARRVVGLILGRPSVQIVERVGGSVVSREIQTTSPGYAEAVCLTVGPPLAAGQSGRIMILGPPEEMVERVWRVISGGEPAPRLFTQDKIVSML